MKKREFIIQDLLSKIYQEQYPDGKLPNQRALAKLYGVSRFTIQQAIKNLEEIGKERSVKIRKKLLIMFTELVIYCCYRPR